MTTLDKVWRRIELDKELVRKQRLATAKRLLEQICSAPLNAELDEMRDELHELRVLLWELENDQVLQ
jgi:hypothetical protein